MAEIPQEASVIDDRHPYDIALEELAAELAAEQQTNPRAALQSPATRIAPRATGGMPEGTNFVPPIPTRGSLTSANTPLGDLAGTTVGPGLGHFVSGIDRTLGRVADVGGEGNRMLRDTAYEFTGIPGAQRGGVNLAEAAASGDMPRAAGAMGQIAFSALPTRIPTGRLVDDIVHNAARYVGIPLAASTSISPLAHAGDDGSGNLTKLLETQSTLRDQAEAARLRRESFRPKNGRAPDFRDVQYSDANAEYTRLARQLDAINTQVGDEQKKNSPEYQEQLRQQREANRVAEQAKRAATPTREMFSDTMPWLYPVTAGLAATAGGSVAARALGNSNRMLGDISTRWQSAIDRAREAGPNTIARREAVMEAQGLNQMYQESIKDLPNAMHKAFMSGAKIGTIGAFAPEEIDFARAVAGQPLWGSLKETMIDDYPTTLRRAGMAAGLGGLTGTTGAIPSYVVFGRGKPPDLSPETRALSATTPEPRIPSKAAAKRLAAPEQPVPLREALPAPDVPRAPAPETPARSAPRARGKSASKSVPDDLPEGHTFIAKGKGSKVQGPDGKWATMPQKQSTQVDDTRPYGRGRVDEE